MTIETEAELAAVKSWIAHLVIEEREAEASLQTPAYIRKILAAQFSTTRKMLMKELETYKYFNDGKGSKEERKN